MNRVTLTSIKDRFKGIFDTIQLMEIEDYGYCHLMENFKNDLGQQIKIEVYEMDCKTYLIKYTDRVCVRFTDITAIKR